MAKKSNPTKRSIARRQKAVTADTVFQHLLLRNVRLVDIESHVRLISGQLPTENQIVFNVNIGHTPDEKYLNVNSLLTVYGRPKDSKADDSNISTLHIQITYQCVYEIKDATLKNLLKHSSQIASSGALVMWPQLRELVQSITAKMVIPPVVLPMFAAGTPANAEGPIVTLFDKAKRVRRIRQK